MAERKDVFISYKHLDDEWRSEIRKWLKPLEDRGLIDVWDDTEIQPGDEWRREIQKALDKAKLAVLLVTQDFLISEFIGKEELPTILEKAENEGLRILWVAVKPSTYADTAIGKYQALNDPFKPLSGLQPAERDQQMFEIYQKIKGVLDA